MPIVNDDKPMNTATVMAEIVTTAEIVFIFILLTFSVVLGKHFKLAAFMR